MSTIHYRGSSARTSGEVRGHGAIARGCLRALAACAILLVLSRPETAAAADAPLPDPITTRQNAFSIPFNLPESNDPIEAPVEIRLYVSTDSGQTWSIAARVGPKQRNFAFRPPRDGQYWFVIRTLDHQNRLKPDNGRTPELRVIVDTLPPRLELSAHRTADGDTVAHWVAIDPLLQADTLKIEFQSVGESIWHAVTFDPPAADPNRSSASGDVTWRPAAPAIVVRAEIRDRAGNVGTAQAPVGQGQRPGSSGQISGGFTAPELNPPGNAPYRSAPANSATPVNAMPNASPRQGAPPVNGERHDLTAGLNPSRNPRSHGDGGLGGAPTSNAEARHSVASRSIDRAHRVRPGSSSAAAARGRFVNARGRTAGRIQGEPHQSAGRRPLRPPCLGGRWQPRPSRPRAERRRACPR